MNAEHGSDSNSTEQLPVEDVIEDYLNQIQAGLKPAPIAHAARRTEAKPSITRRLILVDKLARALRDTSRPSAQSTPCRERPERTPTVVAILPQVDQEQERILPEVASWPAVVRRAVKCPQCGSVVLLVGDQRSLAPCQNCGGVVPLKLDPPTVTYFPNRPTRIGHFAILEELGRGGFGVVFKAYDIQLRRLVALKVPRAELLGGAEHRDRFLREARHAAKLRHPNIVRVLEVLDIEGGPCIISEYIDGTTLADQLASGLTDFRHGIKIVSAVCEALAHAHDRKIVHRDVKPGNILIDRAGQPYLTDFGLARQYESEITITLEGQVVGTPAYMSPEMASGGQHQRVSDQTDVYSLGVILYRMLTGVLPFQGTRPALIHQVLNDEPRPPCVLNEQLPRDLETICLKAMEKDLSRRYSSAHAMGDDLRRWLNGEPIRARPISRLERLWRWSRRNRLVAGLAAAILVLLSVGAIGAGATAVYERGLRSDAEAARQAESNARQEAQQAAIESRERLIGILTAEGVRKLDERDSMRSLVWFAESLNLEDDAVRQVPHRTRLGMIERQCPKLHQVVFHDAAVLDVSFAPDGRHFATASADGTARIWDTATGQPVTPPLRHVDLVSRVTFSHDGLLVATASRDRTAQVWRVADGTRVGPALPHAGWVRHASFSPDGKAVVTASDDDTAQIWDFTAGQKLGPALRHRSHVIEAWFSPDGRRLLTSCGLQILSGEAQVWDARTGLPVASELRHGGWVWSARFSGDGRRVVTAGADGSAQVWDAETAEQLTPPLRHDGQVLFAEFSPDGRRVVTVSEDHTARLWDAESGRALSLPMRHDATVFHAAFGPGGRRVITASADGTVRVWSGSNGRSLAPPLPHAAVFDKCAFSPDGRFVVGAGQDGVSRLWDLAAGLPSVPALSHEGRVTAVAFAPDNQHVATSSADGTAQLWNAATGEPAAPGIRHQREVLSVIFSPEGRLLLTCSGDESAQLWNPVTSQRVGPPLKHDRLVRRGAFRADGKLVVTVSDDRTARLWSVPAGELLHTLPHGGVVFHASFSHDGRRLVTACEDQTARLWDVETGQVLRMFQQEGARKSRVWRSFFSPDDRWILTATEDSAIIWDADTGERLATLTHSGLVLYAEFSRDGRRVVTSSYDGTSKLWIAPFAIPATRPMVQQGMMIPQVSFSPDGRWVLTVAGRVSGGNQPERDEYGEARLWDAGTGQPVSPPLQHGGRLNEASFSPDGRRAITASTDATARVWDLTPDVRPANDIRQLTHILAGMRISPVGGMEPYSVDDLKKHWPLVRSKYPESFQPSRLEVLAWRSQEASECEEAGEWNAAVEHLNAMLDSQYAGGPTYRRRGRAHSELGEWEAAARDFASAISLGRDAAILRFHAALAHLAAQDVDSFQRETSVLVDRFQDVEIPLVMHTIARALTVTEHAELAPKVVRYFERASQDYPSHAPSQSMMGAILYRQGKFESAIARLDQAVRIDGKGTVRDWLFLAIAHHRLGHTEESAKWMDRGVQALKEQGILPDHEAARVPRDSIPWDERFELSRLGLEAKAVLGKQDESQTSPSIGASHGNGHILRRQI